MEWIEIAAAVITIITGLIAISGVAQSIKKKRELSPVTTAKDQGGVAERFVSLFEAHGIHQNQIPDFFGHELTIADVSSPKALINKLSPLLIKDAAELFTVNIEWLQGAIDSPYPTHHFYKQPADFERFVDDLASNGNKLGGYVFNSKRPDSAPDEYDAAIVITEEISRINNRPVYKIHICNGWVFSYWKSRGYLAACIAITWRKGIHLIGKQVDPDWLTQFVEGNTLIGYDYEDGDLKYPAFSTWYADEMVERPAKYLKWVDPEQDKFGLKSALRLWLELDAKEYMQIYFDGTHKSVQSEFRDVLDRLNTIKNQ